MKRTTIALTVVLALFTVVGNAWGEIRYTVTELGSLPGGDGSCATGINDKGQVVGYATASDGKSHAFLYSGGIMQDLGVLAYGGGSYAYGINDNGQITGTAITSENKQHAIIVDNGHMVDMGTLAWSASEGYLGTSMGYDINNSGQAAGYSSTATTRHASLFSLVLSDGGWGYRLQRQDLGTISGGSSTAQSINDLGQIVGYSTSYDGADSHWHAFLSDGSGPMQDLGTLGGNASKATAINNRGQVVGYSEYTVGDTQVHAFVWNGSGTLQDLGTLGGDYSAATAINDRGQIVGMATTQDGIAHMFLSENGSPMYDLEAQIESFSGWPQLSAVGINDNGQIIFNCSIVNGHRQEDHAFLLTPVPEPSTLVLLGIGAISLLAFGWCRFRSCGYGVLFVLVFVETGRADILQMPFGQTSLEMVPVGNPGNTPDGRWTQSPYYESTLGGVQYGYRISKYEITAAQYTEFLNAVAKTDNYGLYNPTMADTMPGFTGCNIQRSGSSGTYSYSVSSNWRNRPVNSVSWGDTARFANWMSNGQPTGTQGLGTTEDGSYYLNGATSDVDLMRVVRKTNATWVIPTIDEWFKAAYHKNDGTTGNYWNYPTQSDDAPSHNLSSAGTNNANFYRSGYTIGSPYYMTEVGAFANTPGPYGTFDQAGNVWEWHEVNDSAGWSGFLGGSFNHPQGSMHLPSGYNTVPTYENRDVGFRVANVPEPSTLALVGIVVPVLFVLIARQRRRVVVSSSEVG